MLFFGPLILIAVAKPTVTSFWAGLVLVLVGECIRMWATGYLRKLSELITAGPFAMCRNPLYVGSFIITTGYLVMCNQVLAYVIGIVVFWLFHGGAVAHEEKLLLDKFGDDFVSYCRAVPRFLPRSFRMAGSGGFSMQQIWNNDEYCGLFGSLGVSAVFAVIAYRPDLAPLVLIRSLWA